MTPPDKGSIIVYFGLPDPMAYFLVLEKPRQNGNYYNMTLWSLKTHKILEWQADVAAKSWSTLE